MPHKQSLVALKEEPEEFYGLATFEPDLHRPCPSSCGEVGEDAIPNELYIHLSSKFTQLSGCSWCIGGLCNWCTIDPFAANDPHVDPGQEPYDPNRFRGGVLRYIKMRESPVTGDCSCQHMTSNSDCCWCIGSNFNDEWQYPPTDCNGFGQLKIPGEQHEKFEGQLYRGGLFCTQIMGFNLWVLFFGTASCPPECHDPVQNPYDSQGCGPDCDGGDLPQCLCSIDWFMIYVKVNIVEPPHANGKPQGSYDKLFSGTPDENNFLCGTYVEHGYPSHVIIDEEPEPHGP